MGISLVRFIRSTTIFLAAIVLMLAVSSAHAQTSPDSSTKEEVATTATPVNNGAAAANLPVLKDYRGVSIGMTADKVRSTLDRLKKDKKLDVYAFSDAESAQIYYDDEGTVMAISVDYFGDKSKAPTPETVVGSSLEPKTDGSMYLLKRYPDAGYWVSYNRTAGDKPIVTVTMQRM